MRTRADSLALFIAEGFGAGWVPKAPGTVGTVVGLGWMLALLASGNLWYYLGGTVAGLALSIWLCGRAEFLLGKTDPGSVVLDEIAAMPVCFGVWIALHLTGGSGLPSPGLLLHGSGVWVLVLGFALFRVFDIAKPWPVHQSQRLPGGWGITIDDLLAAVYVNLVWIAGLGMLRLTGH